MVPIGRRQRHLDLSPSFLWYEGLEILILWDIRGFACVFNLAGAYNTGLYLGIWVILHENGDVRHIWPEPIHWWRSDLFHAVEGWKECTPEHVPSGIY
jgi:hypothetical protein